MDIIFRVDSSDTIGGGHLTRCINIANELKKRKINSYFICQNLIGLDIKLLNKSLHKYKIIPETNYFFDDANETIKFIKERNIKPENIIVDHYELDANWEKLVKKYTRKLTVIDDLAHKKHYCDILINQVLGVETSKYKDLVPKNCKLFLGNEYIIMRPQFFIERNKLPNKIDFSNITDVHLFFSSNDNNGLTLKYTELFLKQFPEICIHLSLGNYFKDLEKLKELSSKNKKIKWVQNNSNIEKQLSSCQIAIGTPGMMTWERACMGIPSIQFGTKDFQDDILEKLSKYGLCIWLGNEKYIDEKNFIKICRNFFEDKALLAEMRNKCLKTVDGKGIQRVIDILLDN